MYGKAKMFLNCETFEPIREKLSVKIDNFKSIKKSEWAFLVGMFIYSTIPLLGGLVRVSEIVFGLNIMPPNPRATALPAPIVVHILTSLVYCSFGALQFVKSIREMSPSGHKLMGKMVVVCGLVSAVTGLWMTVFYDFPLGLQSFSLYWIRLVLGSLMVIFIFWSLALLKKRKIPKHGQYMIRAYAIGQGASTQAILGIGSVILLESEPSGIGRDVVMIGSWVINIIAAEWLIRKIYFAKNAY